MEEPVKPGLGRRARKALDTRHRMLDAAEALFVRDGYAATTIAAIAEEADVAVQTVYAVFGTKRAILTELLAVRVVGDENTSPAGPRGMAGHRTGARPPSATGSVRSPRHPDRQPHRRPLPGAGGGRRLRRRDR